MRHIAAALVLTLGCASLDAALPLALIGKQLVKSIVQSVVEDAIYASLNAALGPCDGALASAALANAQALAGSRGALPGMAAGAVGAIAGAGALPGGLPIDMSTLGLATRIEDLPPQFREVMEKERAERLRELREDQKRRGLTPAQIAEEDRRLTEEQLRQAEEFVAMVRDAKPLSSAEIDEFVAQYERLSKLAPEGTAVCSAASMRRLLAPATALPMAAGPIRMMLKSLRELDRELAESRRTFAAMTPEERAEFMRQMNEQIEDWTEQDRQGFAQLLRTNAFGMPDELRSELLKKLN